MRHIELNFVQELHLHCFRSADQAFVLHFYWTSKLIRSLLLSNAIKDNNKKQIYMEIAKERVTLLCEYELFSGQPMTGTRESLCVDAFDRRATSSIPIVFYSQGHLH